MPLNSTRLCLRSVSITTSLIAASRPFWPFCASICSTRNASDSATIVFSTAFGFAVACELPTARNSNLLPVNANGDVRLRSVASRGSGGSAVTPRRIVSLRFSDFAAVPATMLSTTSVSCSPR